MWAVVGVLNRQKVYRMYQEEFVILWENILQLKLHQYVRTYLYRKFNVYKDHYAKSFKEKTAFILLEITKYILK